VAGTVGDPDDASLSGLTAVWTVVVQTPGGGRHALEGWPVPLDGAPHDLTLPFPVTGTGEVSGEVQVVALVARVAVGGADFRLLPSDSTRLEVTTRIAASGSDADALAPT